MSEAAPAPYKFVVLINKKIAPAVALNALGHMALGLASMVPEEMRKSMRFVEFVDKDAQRHPSISALSLVVLQGTSGNIRNLRGEARRLGIPCVDFTSTMTGGTYEQQIEATAQTAEADLEYYGVLLFGSAEQLKPLTKSFSLYRQGAQNDPQP